MGLNSGNQSTASAQFHKKLKSNEMFIVSIPIRQRESNWK